MLFDNVVCKQEGDLDLVGLSAKLTLRRLIAQDQLFLRNPSFRARRLTFSNSSRQMCATSRKMGMFHAFATCAR